jgi:hypothetical protein
MIPLNSNDNPYNLMIFSAITAIGFILKMFFSQNISKGGIDGPANASIMGYSVIIFALLGLLFIAFTLASKSSFSSSALAIITGSMPIVFLLGILIWKLLMNIKYQKRINRGNVPSDYSRLDSISTILIMFQCIVIFMFLSKQSVAASNVNNVATPITKAYTLLASQTGSLSYLFGVINVLMLTYMQVLLNQYSTDG